MPDFRAPDSSKQPKEQVSYRAKESCSLCVTFIPPNSCEITEGNISPDAVCNNFRLEETSKPWNKEFYKKEYVKEGE